MAWIVTFAILIFAYRRVTRARDRLEEVKPTGMLSSPLFDAQTALLCVLAVLILTPTYVPHERWGVTTYLAILFIVLVALFFVRRALKWRYPI
jgi:ABC-type xylose transport system permease subunit